jgi:diguanylate cyclase (GGDEF)-like protein/PAS domain S-box-containing protein
MRRSTPGSFSSPDVLIGGALILLGCSTILGWLLHVPILMTLWKGLLPMVFNTGLGFLLTGVALCLRRPELKPVRLVRQGIGFVLMLFGALTLCEQIFDTRLGIDFASLQTWYDYGNTRAGRMAPNTALGFVLIGATIYLSSEVRSRRQAIAVALLTFCVLTVGLTGLVGYLLSPELLYNWARSARMALHTAAGMIACAFGLWSAWSHSSWYTSEKYFREEGKIRFLSAAIFMVSMITIGLIGFASLENKLTKAAENRLEAIIKLRGPWFAALTKDAAHHARSAIELSSLAQSAGELLSGGARKQFTDDAQRLLDAGYRGVAVTDNAGQQVLAAGRLNNKPELAASLDPSSSVELVWDDEMLVRVHYPVQRGGQVLGHIVIDQAAPALGATLFEMPQLEDSGELAVCIGGAGLLHCFPNTKNAKPFTAPMRAAGVTPLPMQLALAGQHGIVYGIDYRGSNVLAAYDLLAPGVGIVAKQATADAYAGIRNALRLGAPIILVISLLAAWFLRVQLNPLVSKMRRSEQEAADFAAEMETIMAAAGDGIVIIDHQGRIESLNVAACRIFQTTGAEVVGQSASTLMRPDPRNGRQDDAALLAMADLSQLTGKPNTLIEGVRKGGESFPLEISINVVPLAQRRLLVAILRDITARKEIEDKLFRLAQFDTLTGLPNRALFMDRLATALTRAARTRGKLALMFLDLDGFKAVNDTFGHEGGDVLLQQVSARLLAQVRKSDTVARLAGDEFTIILENLTQPDDGAAVVAQKIVSAIQQPFDIGGKQAYVTVSIGLIVHDASRQEISLADLLRKADNEMYAVKRAGKDGFKVSSVAGDGALI